MFRVVYNHPHREIVNNITGIFFSIGEFELISADENIYGFSAESMLLDDRAEATVRINHEIKATISYDIRCAKNLKKTVSQALFDALEKVFGEKTQYGILTGIRPVKLVSQLSDKIKDSGTVKKKLTEEYRIKPQKADLLLDVYNNSSKIRPDVNKYSMYVHIPFCPSRCSYCTFPSSVHFSETELEEYVSHLIYEIRNFKEGMKKTGYSPETVYIGGGTPAVLSPNNIDRLLKEINSSGDEIDEITFEAGRPDVITGEKLKALSRHNVKRICINTQILNDSVLKKIGRDHTVKEFVAKFSLIRKSEFIINTDLIIGLPGSNDDEENKSLMKLMEMKPENITVHTLSLKKGSGLWNDNYVHNSKKYDRLYKYMHQEISDSGYIPYYLYRQKNTLMNSDNIGYSIKGTECRYNIYMINEIQNVVGFGAGAASKIIDSKKITRLENNRNIKDYYINIDRKNSEKIKYLIGFDNITPI